MLHMVHPDASAANGEKEFSELAIVPGPGAPGSGIRSPTDSASDASPPATECQSQDSEVVDAPADLCEIDKKMTTGTRESYESEGCGRGSQGLGYGGFYASQRSGGGRPSVRSIYGNPGIARASKKDVHSLLSAKTIENLSDIMSQEEKHHTHPPLEPSYPLPLVIFVAFLSVIGGLVVVGVHMAIVYAGCPLGVNGCNSFTKSKEKKGFFVVKWFKRVTDDQIPEDLLYISFSIVGAVIIAAMFALLPEHLNFQIRGGGTIQALVAVATGERILLTAALLRLICSSIYLGSGGTLGLDGPAIQVCTAATTFLGYLVGMRSVPTQSLLACLGFAGGFAATFNSPLAGIMFAMEELQHVSSRMSKHIICVILMASIVATLVARALLANQPLLNTSWNQNLIDSVSGGSLNNVIGTNMWMLVSVPIGILSAFTGFACSRSLRWLHAALRILRWRVTWHFFETAVYILFSTLVACIGSVVFRSTGLRGVWGIGYESLQEAFARDFHAWEYLIVAVGKLSAMVLAVCVRSPGDILEPVLIAGAFVGGGVGSFLQEIIQDSTLSQQVMRPCLVFGMVGLFASCFRFPITPVVIVLELMGVETYALVLPAALCGFTAITVANRLFPPLLDEIMHEDDIDLHDLSKEADDAMEDTQEVLNWMEQGMMAGNGELHPHDPEDESTAPLSPRSSVNSNSLLTPPKPERSSKPGSRRSSDSSSMTSHVSRPSGMSSPSEGHLARRPSIAQLGSGLNSLFGGIEATMHTLSEREGSQVYSNMKRRQSFKAILSSEHGTVDGDVLLKRLSHVSHGGRKSIEQRGSLLSNPWDQHGSARSRISSKGQATRRISNASGTVSASAPELPSPTESHSMPSPTQSHQLLMESHLSAMRAATKNVEMVKDVPPLPQGPPLGRHSKGLRASFGEIFCDGEQDVPGALPSPPSELEDSTSSAHHQQGSSRSPSGENSPVDEESSPSAQAESLNVERVASQGLGPRSSAQSIN